MGSGNNAVEEQFDSGKVSSLGADVEWVLHFVAADGPTYAIGVFFFGPRGGDDAEVRDFATGGDGTPMNEINRVGTFDGAVALGEAANFIGVGRLPDLAVTTLTEFAVLGNLAGVGFDCMTVEGKWGMLDEGGNGD